MLDLSGRPVLRRPVLIHTISTRPSVLPSMISLAHLPEVRRVRPALAFTGLVPLRAGLCPTEVRAVGPLPICTSFEESVMNIRVD